jgi:hypothetical protein
MTPGGHAMSEPRKLEAILVADVVGYSLIAGVDEDHTHAKSISPLRRAGIARPGNAPDRAIRGAMPDLRQE